MSQKKKKITYCGETLRRHHSFQRVSCKSHGKLQDAPNINWLAPGNPRNSQIAK